MISRTADGIAQQRPRTPDQAPLGPSAAHRAIQLRKDERGKVPRKLERNRGPRAGFGSGSNVERRTAPGIL